MRKIEKNNDSKKVIGEKERETVWSDLKIHTKNVFSDSDPPLPQGPGRRDMPRHWAHLFAAKFIFVGGSKITGVNKFMEGKEVSVARQLHA